MKTKEIALRDIDLVLSFIIHKTYNPRIYIVADNPAPEIALFNKSGLFNELLDKYPDYKTRDFYKSFELIIIKLVIDEFLIEVPTASNASDYHLSYEGLVFSLSGAYTNEYRRQEKTDEIIRQNHILTMILAAGAWIAAMYYSLEIRKTSPCLGGFSGLILIGALLLGIYLLLKKKSNRYPAT